MPNSTPEERTYGHLINFLGENVKCMEVGVLQADTMTNLLLNCENISEYHGVDTWSPYVDFVPETQSFFSQEFQDTVRTHAIYNIKKSGMSHKAFLYQETSVECSKRFQDEYFDFIFLDAFPTKHEAVADLRAWYPKLKPNGLFAIDDMNSNIIFESVCEFREEYKITSPVSIYKKSCVWYKK